MMRTTDSRIVLIGVGNIYCGDDGAGPAVAREFISRGIPDIQVIDQIGDGTDLISGWKDMDTAYVIDCMRSGADVGTIRRFDVLNEAIPEDAFPGYTTHAFSISETVNLARILGRLPGRLIVFGIEGEHFGTGMDMSVEVEAAVKTVSDSIEKEINKRLAEMPLEEGE